VKPALRLLAAAALVRLVVAALVPLVPDEAYYWEWSRHLAAGYFDHPPVIAWLIRAGTQIGGATPFGVRAGPIVAGFAGSCAAAALAHRLAGPRGAWRLAVLLSVVPLAGVGLVLATPDAPLLACVAALLWAVDRALAGRLPATDAAPHSDSGRDIVWWIVAGMALGLGASSKYTVVLIPAAIVVAFVISHPLRAELRRPGPYVASVVAACVFLPVVLWNASHDWVSFRFQLHHGLGPVTGSALMRELTLVGGQAGLVSPVLFVLVVCATAFAASRSDVPRRFVLAVVAIFVFGFFAVSAIRRPVEANWPAIAVLPALVLLATSLPGVRRARWERIGVALGGVMVLTVYILAISPVPLLPAHMDPLARAFGWNDLAAAVMADEARDTADGGAAAGGARVWLAADRYQDAAELAFNMPRHPLVFSLNLAGRPNQYDLWPTARDSMRRGDALTAILDDVPDPPSPVARLAPHFSQVVRGPLVELRRGGHVVARRRLWHFLGLTSPL
jgi:4-amino-4-deoxy-L-arabinose transferase-like glycosyltransferase